MAADFYFKQGDTLPLITATLSGADDAAADLTGATVLLHLRRWASDVVLIEEEATIVSAEDGQVEYPFSPEDVELLTPGLHRMEWEVTFADESVLSFPNDGFLTMMVTREIV